MSPTYYIPPQVAQQGIKAVHQRPQCANENSIIVGRFDSAYAYANFPETRTQPTSRIRRNHPGCRFSV